MARQGAYVTGSGSSANWASGIADQLNTLSKSYLDQGAAKDERTRLAAAQAENDRRYFLDRQYRLDSAAESKRRFEITDGRSEKLAKRDADALELVTAENDYYKGITQERVDQIQADKSARLGALEASGVTFAEGAVGDDGELMVGPSVDRRDILGVAKNMKGVQNLVDKVPFYQRDILEALGKEYREKFGKAIDPSRLADVLAGIDNLGTLQTTENARTEAINKNEKDAFTTQIDAANKYLSRTAPGSSKNADGTTKAKTGKVTDWTDILLTPYAKKYEDNAWFKPWNSAQEGARDVGSKVLAALQKNGSNVTAAEANAVLPYMYDKLTQGKSSGDINTDVKTAIKIATDAINDDRKRGVTSSNAANDISVQRQQARDLLHKLGTEAYSIATPVNIQQQNLDNYRKLLDPSFKGASEVVTPIATTPAAEPSTADSTGNTTAASGQSVEELLGLVPTGTEVVPTPPVVEEESITPEQPLSRNAILQGLTRDDVYAVGTPVEKSIGKLERKLVSQQTALYTAIDNGSAQEKKAAEDAATVTQMKLQELQELQSTQERVELQEKKAAAEKKQEIQALGLKHTENASITKRINTLMPGKASNKSIVVETLNPDGSRVPWLDNVADINKRRGMGLGNLGNVASNSDLGVDDGISKEEAKAAEGNFVLQDAMIAEANMLIGNNVLKSISNSITVAKGNNLLQSMSGLLDFSSDFDYDPTLPVDANTEETIKGPSQDDLELLYNDVQTFMDNRSNLSNINSSVMNEKVTDALLLAAPGAALRVKPTSVGKYLKNILTPKPKPTPTPLRPFQPISKNPFQGPPRPSRANLPAYIRNPKNVSPSTVKDLKNFVLTKEAAKRAAEKAAKTVSRTAKAKATRLANAAKKAAEKAAKSKTKPKSKAKGKPKTKKKTSARTKKGA